MDERIYLTVVHLGVRNRFARLILQYHMIHWIAHAITRSTSVVTSIGFVCFYLFFCSRLSVSFHTQKCSKTKGQENYGAHQPNKTRSTLSSSMLYLQWDVRAAFVSHSYRKFPWTGVLRWRQCKRPTATKWIDHWKFKKKTRRSIQAPSNGRMQKFNQPHAYLGGNFLRMSAGFFRGEY